MNKSVKINCRVFGCKFNEAGKCKLDSITLQDDGSPIVGRMICVDAEEDEEIEK